MEGKVKARRNGANVDVRVEAEMMLPAASIQVVKMDLSEPGSFMLMAQQEYRLDLCLSPRLPNSLYGFPERWSPQRYRPPGQVFVVPPEQRLQVNAGQGRQDAVFCSIPKGRLREWIDDDIVWTDARLAASIDVTSVALKRILFQIAEEVRHPTLASAILVEALVIQAAVNLLRYFNGVEEGMRDGGLSARRMAIIDERLDDMSRPPALAELAQLCGLSVRQLARGFKARCGISIGQHVADCRLTIAKRLLADGQSMKTIAYRLGFASPASFVYAFRKATGTTPGSYRERLLSK